MEEDEGSLADGLSDAAPSVGAATDVAPLGREHKKPSHELTADEDVDVADWARVARSPQFVALVRAKRRFIIPATIFFLIYYFALLLLIWRAPELMSRRVVGVVNIAYLFALSQFFMVWILAALYVRAANRHDRMARDIADNAIREAAVVRAGQSRPGEDEQA